MRDRHHYMTRRGNADRRFRAAPDMAKRIGKPIIVTTRVAETWWPSSRPAARAASSFVPESEEVARKFIEPANLSLLRLVTLPQPDRTRLREGVAP